MKRHFALLPVILALFATAQTPTSVPKVCTACIRAHEEFLASDALHGRGSGTADELAAANYIASELKNYHIEPAGDDGFIQKAIIAHQKVTGPPDVRLMTPGDGIPAQTVFLTYGKDYLVQYLTDARFRGELRKMDADKGGKVESGTVALITGEDRAKIRKAMFAAVSSGVAGVLIPASEDKPEHFSQGGHELPRLPPKLESESGGLGGNFNILELSSAAIKTVEQQPQGTKLYFRAPVEAGDKSYTWNAVGILRGSNPALQHAAVLFSAHLDHLGIGKAVNGDNIYNGADDDASGVTAVLELARVLGSGPKPKRTVIFALFGSEETGGLGSTYFREHPPVPLADIAANLEFEMIGRPDPVVKSDTLWLTGWERSNLGPILAAHGAKLVGDPHPDQDFFARSDNYVLAKKGVVAQTVSSYGLHADYHQPSDDLAHLDFQHMDAAIQSLLGPVEWLVNSDFKPRWNEGGKP